MDESIITVTSSVSKLSAYIFAVRIDMNIMSNKLEKKFQRDHCSFSDNTNARHYKFT
jgi:hypothetical protein